MKHYSRGQTLLELVIAIGVVAVIITGLVVAATSSLRFGQESRLRSSAVKYAQEAIELARQMRDTQSWDTFMSYTGSGSQIEMRGPFTRTVTFTWNDPIMTVQSNVSWAVGASQQTTQLQTYLTQWR